MLAPRGVRIIELPVGGGLSVERLMNFLTALDRDADIVIRRQAGNAEGWAHRGDGWLGMKRNR